MRVEGMRVMTRNADDYAVDLLAPVAVLDPVHVHVLPRSGQCRLRRVDDEQGFGVQRLSLRARRQGIYVGYCLFEVPSNLILERVGARFWLARIMITWRLFSGAMAFVSCPVSFATLRFLLGAAAAGFSQVSCSSSITGFRRATAGG